MEPLNINSLSSVLGIKMDWSKVKQAIGTIAPWLAASFGTPAAVIGTVVITFNSKISFLTPYEHYAEPIPTQYQS